MEDASLAPLDPLEERVLVWLAVRIYAGDELSVRQVMSQHGFGAPATIHTRLKAMRRKGWIMLADTTDRRRKRIELTQATRRHFGRLGRTIVRTLAAEAAGASHDTSR